MVIQSLITFLRFGEYALSLFYKIRATVRILYFANYFTNYVTNYFADFFDVGGCRSVDKSSKSFSMLANFP